MFNVLIYGKQKAHENAGMASVFIEESPIILNFKKFMYARKNLVKQFEDWKKHLLIQLVFTICIC